MLRFTALLGLPLGLLAGLVVGSLPAAAQVPSAGASLEEPFPLPSATYDPSDYAGGGQNWAVAHDTLGRVLVGNNDGVLVFDGANWLPSLPTANGSVARTLARSSSGRIYVGGTSEIGVITTPPNADPLYRPLSDRLPDSLRAFGDVWRGFVSGDDALFVLDTRVLLYDADADTLAFWTIPSRATRLVRARDSLFALTTTSGLEQPYVYADGAFHPTGSALARTLTRAAARYSAREGDTDFVLARSALLAVRPDRVDTLRAFPARRVNSAWAYEMEVVDEGVVAVATIEEGVFLAQTSDGRVLRRLTKASGLLQDVAQCLSRDLAGGVWVCHDIGLSRVQVRASARTTRELPLDSPTLSARYDGALYLASIEGVARVESEPDGLLRRAFFEASETRALLSTPYGLLVGYSDGVFATDGTSRQRVELPEAWLQHTEVLLAASPDTSRVAAGLLGGICLLRFENGRWSRGRCQETQGFTSIYSGTRGPRGDLWFGSSFQGLLRMRYDATGDSLRVVERYGGSLLDHEVAPVVLGGRLYALGDTVLRFSDAGFTGDTTALGRALNAVTPLLVFESAPGEGAIGANRQGAYELTTSAPYVRPFAHRALNRSDVQLLARDVTGALLAFGPSWATRFPSLSPATPPPAAPRLSRLVHSGPDSTVAMPHALRPEQRDLMLHFGTLAADLTGPTHYRSRLAGEEDEWSRWSEASTRVFTNLAPGAYAFETQARDAWGRESPVRTATIRILGPWYQSWWARLLLLGLSTGLLALAVSRVAHWRGRQLAARNAELEAVVAQRTARLAEQARALERLNAQLEGSNARLEQSDRQKTALLGVAAHDLRNPIANIKSLAELLHLDLPHGADEPRELVSLIHESSEVMLDLIEDLLRSNEAERGVLKMDFEPVELAGAARSAVEAVRARASAKEQTIALTDAPGCVRADLARTRDVMLNLLSNAVKYSPRGSRIAVTVGAREQTMRFAVADQGPGLTPDDQARLFQPFQKLSARPTEGESSTGLGLYIVRQYVEQMGGRVGAESAPGRGSTFWFELPALDSGGTDADADAAQASQAAA